jgi:hypothetical protein
VRKITTTGVLRNGSRQDDTQNGIIELKRRLAKKDSLIATYHEYEDA